MEPTPRPWERWLVALVLLLVGGHVAWFFVVTAQRVGYPYELEWMEGSLVDHVARVLAGEDLYTAPGVDHICYLYTPLYYYVSAGVAWCTGLSFLPLRLVALAASLGCALCMAWIVRREVGGRAPMVVAGGFFVAGFWIVDGWHDLARNDSLFLLLIALTIALLRGDTDRRVLVAGAVVTLAFLAKQLTLVLLPPLAIGLACLSFRRAVLFTITTTLGLGLAVGLYSWLTDGWFFFYVFEMPQNHGRGAPPFWTEDMRPLWISLGLGVLYVASGLRRDARRRTGFYGVIALGLLVATHMARHHTGGHINALMPWLLGGGLLLGLVLGRAAAWPPLARVAVLVAIGGQFVWLFDTSREFLPRAAHRQESARFLAYLQGVEGEVFVPFHGHIAAAAGKQPSMHGMAMHDLRATRTGEYSEPFKQFLRSLGASYASRRFAVIVINEPQSFVFFDGEKEIPGYRRIDPPFDPRALVPLHGMVTRPELVFERID